jgi:parallel beta-helix repeat protein
LDGISLDLCNRNNITRNEIRGNPIGIYLYLSEDNSISENNISDNGNGIQLLWDCDNNNIFYNNISSNGDEYGIALVSSEGNNISYNNISENWYGLYCWNSKYNDAFNNVFTSNWYAIYLRDSVGISITNNSMNRDGIYIQGNQLQYWNTHYIDTSNTVNGKQLYYLKNQTSGIIPDSGGQVILTNCSNITVSQQNLSYGTVSIQLGFSSYNSLIKNNASFNSIEGISLYYSFKNEITGNNASMNNMAGIKLSDSDHNILTKNLLSNNEWGIYLFKSDWNQISINNMSSNSNYGVRFSASKYNTIYHNNFLSNSKQAFTDTIKNDWDNGYPLGGNYWSDYSGVDLFKGPEQDIPGIDSIGDTSYPIDTNTLEDPQDNYPLMEPYTYKPLENYTILKQGWNLISIPNIQDNQNLLKVLAGNITK